mmetsp:Transcript_73663/g.203367  ORF Transcript_73663/g.203367 Transcript_73663/m.203367 type:complete len:252 (-) Transcript_73663:32-787(-)
MRAHVREVCLQQRPGAAATERSAPCVGSPSSFSQQIEETPVVVGWNTAVGCPPPPLQRAQGALEVTRDLEAHLVRTCAGRQVPALPVPRVNGLAIPPTVIGHAVAWWRCTLELHAVETALCVTRRWTDLLITEAEFKVPHVVSSNLNDELHRTPGSQGCKRPRQVPNEVAVGPPLTAIATSCSFSIAALRAIGIRGAADGPATERRVGDVAMPRNSQDGSEQQGDAKASRELHGTSRSNARPQRDYLLSRA